MYYISYDNFDEFKDIHPDLAEELLNEVDEGEWQNDTLYHYRALADYAQYELEECLYSLVLMVMCLIKIFTVLLIQ